METPTPTTENINSEDINSEKTTFNFDADIQQLMHLIIHTFYSNKDIFLRELISNASDALDKARHNALNMDKTSDTEDTYDIRIKIDEENKILTIEDTGIGMSKDDLLNNIGTIAHSGTSQFVQSLKDSKDLSMIGQFGVGFYSAFLVADKIRVITRKEDSQYIWESHGGTKFELTEDLSENKLTRGTRIELYLKDDSHEYLTEYKLKNIILQHSQYISYPINLLSNKTRDVEVVDEEVIDKEPINAESADLPAFIEAATFTESKEGYAFKSGDQGTGYYRDEVTVEDVGDVSDKQKKMVKENYSEWEVLNDQKPIWIKSPDDISTEEYKTFYTDLTKKSNAPSEYYKHKHFSVEGNITVKGLLYIPKQNQQMGFMPQVDIQSKIKLHVRRVFISEECKNLIPEYMNFVTGVIDSDDLPLTVSREMLQENKTIDTIKKLVTKQVLSMIDELQVNKDLYNEFYSNYSKNLKLGYHEDQSNRDKISKLLRFYSSKSDQKLISLDEYITNMKEDQPGIYYIAGESISKVADSPFLERLKKKDYEVLFLVDAIDEYVAQNLTTFKDKKLISITKSDIDLGDSEEHKTEIKEKNNAFKHLCDKMKDILGNLVEGVVVSDRIVDSPCCLVTAEWGWSANMERIMKAQPMSNQMGNFMSPKKTLELNAEHQLVKGIFSKFDTIDQNQLKDFVFMLYETSVLNSGFTLDNPGYYSNRIYHLMEQGLDYFDEKTLEPEAINKESEEELVNNLSEVNNPVESSKEEMLDDIEGIEKAINDINKMENTLNDMETITEDVLEELKNKDA